MEEAKESLRAACACGDLAAIRRILSENEALLNEPLNKEEQTALYVAAKENQVEVVRYLLSTFRQINVNAQDSSAECPLYRACFYGRDEIVDLLLATKRVDINIQETSGWTPLHAASFRGFTPMLRKLLAVPGIDVDIKNKWGKSAEEICCGTTVADLSQKPIISQIIQDWKAGRPHERVAPAPLPVSAPVHSVPPPPPPAPATTAAPAATSPPVAPALKTITSAVVTETAGGETMSTGSPSIAEKGEEIALEGLARSLPDPSETVISDTAPAVNYELAWELLDGRKSSDPIALTALLDELGLEAAADLRYLEADDIAQICSLLKKIPQLKFRELLRDKD